MNQQNNDGISEMDDDPACNISGRCEVDPGPLATSANCMHCGKELHKRADGQWYTWDAPPNGGRPQWVRRG